MGLGGHGYARRGAGRRFPGLALFGEALVLFAAVLWVRLTSSYIVLTLSPHPPMERFCPRRERWAVGMLPRTVPAAPRLPERLMQINPPIDPIV